MVTTKESESRFGSEREVSRISGYKVATLRRDRAVGRRLFPFFKIGHKVVYDLDEVERIIRAGRRETDKA